MHTFSVKSFPSPVLSQIAKLSCLLIFVENASTLGGILSTLVHLQTLALPNEPIPILMQHRQKKVLATCSLLFSS